MKKQYIKLFEDFDKVNEGFDQDEIANEIAIICNSINEKVQRFAAEYPDTWFEDLKDIKQALREVDERLQ